MQGVFKVRLIFVFGLFFLVTSLWARGKSQWELLSRSQVICVLQHSAFEDPQWGVCGGHRGHIHRSTDGGQIWQQMEQAQGIWARMYFELLDQNFAVSSGLGGSALTRDGGETWEKFHQGDFSTLSFSDEHTGWMAQENLILRNNQDLQTWEEVSPPEECQGVQALSVVSRDRAWIWDSQGALFRTEDGGDSWESLGLMDWLIERGFQPQPEDVAMRFCDNNQGLLMILEGGGSSNWLVCETADGGDNWKVHRFPDRGEEVYFSRGYISHDLQYVTLLEYSEDYPHVSLFRN